MFSLNHLHHSLDNTPNHASVLFHVSPNTVIDFTTEVIAFFSDLATDQSLIKLIAFCLADIAIFLIESGISFFLPHIISSSLICIEHSKMDEFLTFLFSAVSSPRAINRETVLGICFSTIVERSPHLFSSKLKTLASLIETALTDSESFGVKNAGIHLLGTVLESLTTSSESFQQFSKLPPLCLAV